MDKENQSDLVVNESFSAWKVQFRLLRCGGRIQNANVPFSMKHSIFYDEKHHLTTLIVGETHRRVQHYGVMEMLTEVCNEYWIVCGRSLVRCQCFEGRPLHAPPAPPLSMFQVNEALSFTNTTVDFTGPLYV